MTEPVSLEEWADQRVRESAEQPMDFSGLESAPHIAGVLHTAAPGDSISSIVGSSDPAAIGAFMQANDLNGTAIRAGENYIVPEPGSFDAPGTKALGQAGLDADNARATQRAQDRLDRSMTAIGTTMSGFDPLKGLLATVPTARGVSHAASPQDAHPSIGDINPSGNTQKGTSPSGPDFEGTADKAKWADRILSGQHLGTTAFTTAVDGANPRALQYLKAMQRPYGLAGKALTAVQEAALVGANTRDGMPIYASAPAGALRTAGLIAATKAGEVTGSAAGGALGRFAAARAGALAGLRVPGPPQLRLALGVGGGIIGGLLGDNYIPSSRKVGERLQQVAEESAKNPFFGVP